MILKKLRDYLDSHHIRYVVISHSTAYTAQETAQAAHVHGADFAKTIIVKLDGELAMVVVPAQEKVDLDLVRGASRAARVELAHEYEFQDRFPECEVGAMPPFGGLFGMDVYVEEALTRRQRIAFNAGSHTDLVQLAFSDYQELVKPKVACLTMAYAA